MDIQDFLADINDFIGDILLPVIFGVALISFLVNVVRYFVLAKNDESKRENARRIALYSIGAFVFIAILWGIVNIITYGINIDGETPLQSDYIEESRFNAGFFGGSGFSDGDTIFLEEIPGSSFGSGGDFGGDSFGGSGRDFGDDGFFGGSGGR